MSSPSAEGDVGAIAVIGAETAADGITDGDERVDVVSIGTAVDGGATFGGGGVITVTSTGGAVGVPVQSSRARGAVETRPIAAPHATQKRCPGGFVALHAGQIAGPSALNDFENLKDGASGR